MKQAYLGKDIKVKDNQVEKYDTGWVSLNDVVKYKRIGDVVSVVGNSNGEVNLTSGSYITVGTLPENVRPPIQTKFEYTLQGGLQEGRAAYILPTGEIRLYFSSGPGISYWGFTITYIR